MSALVPNSLYYGDCLEVLKQWPAGVVDLCYLDPPFNSKTDYNILFGDRRENAPQMVAFTDTWQWDEDAILRTRAISRASAHPAQSTIKGLHIALGASGMMSYLSYMAERLVEIKRVLKSNGSVYLHCNQFASHYLKLVADAVFGQSNFINEIIWNYGTPSGGRAGGRKPVKVHDSLLCYAKSYGEHIYNRQHTPYSEKYVRDWFRHVDDNGRQYRTRTRNGDVIRQYLDESPGMPLSTVWSDIMQLSSRRGWFPTTKGEEETGYPTQKPQALLERIIQASSSRGDLVLDPFCGCGTTVAAARQLNRQWVGVDISHFAIDMVKGRRLRDSTIPVHGVPVDLVTASVMAREKPLDFEKWAITRVPGLVPNRKQSSDSGIDGQGHLLNPTNGGLVLAQVKGGKFSLSHLRDFNSVVQREKAELGVYITLNRVRSKNAYIEATSLGEMNMGATRYPKVQLWSMADYFDEVHPRLPPLVDPYTGKPMQMDLLLS